MHTKMVVTIQRDLHQFSDSNHQSNVITDHHVYVHTTQRTQLNMPTEMMVTIQQSLLGLPADVVKLPFRNLIITIIH